MDPAFIWYWKRRHHPHYGACGAYAYASSAAGPGRRRRPDCGPDLDLVLDLGSARGPEDPVFGGGGLGVRRPLRLLARRLDLSDEQIEEAARILERLKIERAQAAVDLRRTAADLADAFGESEFGSERASDATRTRVETARRVQDALTAALRELHALLDGEQRSRLATLIRRGELRI